MTCIAVFFLNLSDLLGGLNGVGRLPALYCKVKMLGHNWPMN